MEDKGENTPPQVNNEPKIWEYTSQNKTSRRQAMHMKDSQHCTSSGNYKLQLWQHTITLLSEHERF